PGVAAATWPGGDRALEDPLLAAVARVLAYGDAPALADLARRAPGKLVGQGPKASVALVGAVEEPARIAPGLARDVALFDQQGCLSLHAIYTSGDATALAAALSGALAEIARTWPPGPAPLPLAAAVRQVREEAALRGLTLHELPLAAGTVIVEPDPAFRPSPGLRTVRIHPVPDHAAAVAALTPWHGRLQGAALAGPEAWAQESALRALGVSHLALPGELQQVDVGWANGGIDPLVALV
ncbi:MAG TPA: acyl-CoA reductase, partial [Thermoanaerobaculia bacterium]|nr:acyl-CoA reductase [Thermoanaerobaculia bacterium]